MVLKLAWLLSLLLLPWSPRSQELEGQQKPSRRSVTPEAQIFATVKPAVVTVLCGGSQGSGFLVDSSGLILTNSHVIRSGDPVKLKLSTGKLYRAEVLLNDGKADVAVLWANSDLFRSIKPIPLPDPSDPPPFEGERILCIGSPLHQELVLTSGIVSRVNQDAIISDVNINHGNSGGPVLNLDGKAVGLATFLDPGGNGPGLSGIVRIEVAQTVLSKAKALLTPEQKPDARPLPQPRYDTLPEEEVAAKASELKKPEMPFLKAPRNFRTYILTPFIRERLALEELKEYEKEWRRTIGRRYKNSVPPKFTSHTSAFWEKYVGIITSPVIVLNIVPAPQETSESQWRGFLGALVGTTTPKTYEFRDDVTKVEILVNGTTIEPYDFLKVPFSEFRDSYFYSIRDVAFGAVIKLDPIAFRTGNEVTLKVWKNDRKEPDVIKVPKSFQEKIWSPFEAWYRRLDESQRNIAS